MNKCLICGKNSDSEYCFSHKPRKPLNKGQGGLKKGGRLKSKGKTEEEKEEAKNRQIEDSRVYNEVWQERKHICVSCGVYLGATMLSYHIEHCLPKALYPQYRHNKDNLFLVCLDCHGKKETGFPTEKYAKIIEETKRKFGIS